MKVGVIAGDGVGPEVTAEAVKVLRATGVAIEFVELPWGSAYWHEHGAMMPGDGVDIARGFDAILLGAVGHPSVADDVTLWGLLLTLRKELDLWANIRPVRLLPGVPCPLAGRGPEDIEMLFVRENVEGEYSGAGGRVGDVAVETAVFTRAGIERIVRFAFEQARARRKLLTSATKSNALRYTMVLWDEVVDAVGAEFPDVDREKVLVDALAARMVRNPGSLDVVVASNLFGDILTDLAGAIQGGLGVCASANISPGADAGPGLFEPVHGSAPDIAGAGIANPIGAIWSAALMLEHAGEHGAAARVMTALAEVRVRTRDVGGTATTAEAGDAIAAAVAS